MRPLRVVACVVLTALLAAPVVLPAWAVVRSPSGWAVWAEGERIAGLAGNTAALAAGACLVAVPAGVLLALVLERGCVPGRRFLRGLLLAGLAASFSRGAWLGAAIGALGLAAAASVAIVTPNRRGNANAPMASGRNHRRAVVLGLWALVIAGVIAVGLLGRAGLLPAPLD